MPDLRDQVLELDVSRMHQGDLEAMDVQVRETIACEHAGRAVVVGVDVRDHEAAQLSRA